MLQIPFRSLLPAMLLAAAAAPVSAQSACVNPQTQLEMTDCAAQQYRLADEDLNLAYRLAIARAEAIDAALGPGTEEALRQAQRAWIPFRDAACEAESHMARGGSMQPMLRLTCLERLTRSRTEALRFFGEVN